MKTVYLALSAISLAGCASVPFLYLTGCVSFADYKLFLAIGSAGWFVFATLWAGRRKRP